MWKRQYQNYILIMLLKSYSVRRYSSNVFYLIASSWKIISSLVNNPVYIDLLTDCKPEDWILRFKNTWKCMNVRICMIKWMINCELRRKKLWMNVVYVYIFCFYVKGGKTWYYSCFNAPHCVEIYWICIQQCLLLRKNNFFSSQKNKRAWTL